MKTLNNIIRTISHLIVLPTLTLAMLYGCEDSRMHNMVEDSVYLLKKGFVRENIALWKTSDMVLPVIKGGVGQSDASVRLKIDEQLLSDYNTENGTDYKMLPSDCYTLNRDILDFADGDYEKSFVFNLNLDKVRELNKTPDEYVLPCALEVLSAGDKVKVNTEPTFFAPAFMDAYVQFTKSTDKVLITSGDEEIKNYLITAEKIYPTENDLNITIELDESLIADYNQENGTNLELLPSAVYGGQNRLTLTIPSSSEKESYILELHKSSFSVAGKYLLPLRITAVSENSINPKKSTLVVEITFSLDMINPLARWAEYNIGELNKFAEGDPKTTPGSYFQFGRNIPFPAYGNLNIVTGTTSPQDPKTWGNAILYLEPLSSANNSKWNWYSEPLDELDTWKKIVNYTGQAVGVPSTYVGTNGGDPSPVGYHVPTWAESVGLIFTQMKFTGTVTQGETIERGIDLLGDGKIANYTAEYKNVGTSKIVGIRFKGTMFESAYEYSINGYATNSAYVGIRAKNIYNGETLDDVLAWTEDDWNGAIVRYFPITGYRLHFNDRSSQVNSNSGKECYFWIDEVLKDSDTNLKRASLFGGVGWQAKNQAFSNGSAFGRDMASPIRPIKDY